MNINQQIPHIVVNRATKNKGNEKVVGKCSFSSVDWHSDVSDKKKEEEFLNIVNDNFLTQLIHQPK